MPLLLRLRLSLLMLGQYAMFGAWFVTLGTYMSKGLHFDGAIGVAYGMQGIAAVISTLFVGVVADRMFSAQKVLAVMLALSAGSLLWLATVTRSEALFLIVVMLHFLAFVPTVPLGTAVIFNALDDPATQFPQIRVVGTFGWILSGIAIGSIAGAAETSLPLVIAGCIGLVAAGYALTLPDTPPRARGAPISIAGLFGLDLLGMIKDRSFWTLIFACSVIMIPLSFYYAYCNNFLQEAGASITIGGKRFEATALQALGQVSELVFLLLLPLFLRRLGIKGVILIGMAGWVVRYTLFAIGFDGSGPAISSLLVIGILLHGICYDFVLVAASIYVEQTVPPEARSRAQSFLAMLNMGLFILIGAAFANMVYTLNTTSTAHLWSNIWAVPAALAAVSFVTFALAFRERHGASPSPG
ncbi:MAG: MFS transporter [Sphingomonadales bacterium]|nr:MFS transporter [Sphingomonadales bacterium]